MPSLFTRRPSTRLLAFVDQAIQSGSTFAAMIFYARSTATEAYASYALAYAGIAVILGFQRSLIILPLLLHKSHSQAPLSSMRWFGLSAVFTLACSLLVMIIAMGSYAADAPKYVSTGLFFLSFMTPAHLSYEFARRAAYIDGRNSEATLQALIFGAILLSGIAALRADPNLLYSVPACFAIGGAAAALYSFARRAGDAILAPLVAFAEWKALLATTIWHLCSFVAYATYTTALPIIVSSIGTPLVVAGVAATRNFVTPALTVITAVDSIDKPAAGRAFNQSGIEGLSRSVNRTRLLVCIITLPMLTVTAVAGSWLLHIAYKGLYDQHIFSVYIWIIFALISAINQPYETYLIILKQTRTLAYAKFAGGVICMVSIVPAVYWLGVSGAVFSGTLAVGVNFLVNFGGTRRARYSSS